jgi:hypothetical protein
MSIPRWSVLLARQLFGAAVVFAGVGLVAVGVSGALSAGLGATAGHAFVAGDPPGVHYTAARCADLREYAPGARTCGAAATEHHFGEVVDYRVAAGALGAVLLGGVAVARRRRRRAGSGEPAVLPRAFVPTVGATVFGGAAAALGAQAVDLAVVGHGRGAGQFLTGAVVAGAVGAWYLVGLGRQLVDGARRVAVTPLPA